MKKTVLFDTLKVLSKALEKNKELPIYDYVCFTEDAVYTANSLLAISTSSLPKQKKAFGVNGPTLIGLLDVTPADDVKFRVEGSDLHIDAALSHFELPIKHQNEFAWSEPEIAGPVLDKVVAHSMKFLLPTCSENQALDGFARVCIKNEAGQIIMYSTDGDAMTRYDTGLLSNDNINVTLARPFCVIISDIVPDGTMTISKEWVCVKNDKFSVYGKNLGETTLDYAKEITDQLNNDETEMIGKPIALEHSLERAIVVASYETSPTLVSIKDDAMYFVTETPFGNIYDEMKTEHEEIEVKINAQLLRKQLAGLGDKLQLKFIPSCVVLKGDKILRLVATQG